MRVGIDGAPLTIPYHNALRHYLENLIFNLAKIDKKNDYLIFTSKKIPIPKQKNFSLILISDKLPILKRQILLPLAVKSQGLDIFHYPDVIGSVFFKLPKTIITVHDLAPSLAWPTWYESPKYAFMKYYNYFVRRYLFKYSSAFIVNSNYISKEFKKFTKLIKPITVIYEGVDLLFNPMKGVVDEFLLAMTDFSPRKNINRTLEAYSLFITKTNLKIPLKAIVSTSYPKSAILAKAKQLRIKKYVKVIENVSSAQLVQLYNRATCFLYPSLYEGFGLPLLEAMASGCPVITSNYGAMKEVTGNAAYLVNPRSVSGIAYAMQRVSTDKKLAEILKKKGLKRAKQFSWRETARKTLKVYEEVYKNG